MVTNYVYAVAGAKGGVGKTTTSINLGATLARAGYTTVVVELDLAMANLVDFLDFDSEVTEEPTLHDVLAGDTNVEAATYELEPGFRLVPSGTDIAGYTATDIDRLPEAVETLRWRNDIVLLDTPAGLSEEVIRPLTLADDAVVVATPRVSAVRNAGNTLELAERVGTPVRGLVLTKSGTGASPGADRISQFLDVPLLGHVPEDDAVPHAQDRGQPVVVDSPNSGAATAYRKIGQQLVEIDRTTTEHRGQEPRSRSAETGGATESGGERADRSAMGRTDDQSVTVPADSGAEVTTNGPGSAGGDAESATAADDDERQRPTDERRRPGAASDFDNESRRDAARSERRNDSSDSENRSDDGAQLAETDERSVESASLGQQIRSLLGF